VSGFDPPLVNSLRSSLAGRKGALIEIAGRDSIAAAVAAARTGSYELFIPTIVYTGTEHGDWETVLSHAASLPERLAGTGVEIFERAIVIGSPAWWHAACGRYLDLLNTRYGFSGVCVACHMYLHAARVPLARETGAGAIIAGERLAHDGRLKLNQLEPALEAYAHLLADHGVTLDMPLAGIDDGRLVQELVGEWPESERQMSCVFEANYRDGLGGLSFEEGRLTAYLEEFLVPFTARVLDAFRADGNATPVRPDYDDIAREVITGRSGS
jgi:hypothetical protein